MDFTHIEYENNFILTLPYIIGHAKTSDATQRTPITFLALPTVQTYFALTGCSIA